MQRPRVHPRALAHCLCAAVLCAASTGARAEPEGGSSSVAGDAVLQLMQDKGLVPREAPPGGPSLVQQVRDRTSDLVLSAMSFIGVQYRLGGTGGVDGMTGFDCSGFTRYVFELSLGLVLPRQVDEQASAAGLSPVARDALMPGDLVFFNTLRRTFSHVGIYVGEGKFIHAPRSGSQVRIEDMRKGYWESRFTGARRVEAGATAR
ncbi:MAG TPA: C40 family peptidase [Rubrivivax sp.]